MTPNPTGEGVSPALIAEIAALENEAYQRGWQDAIAAILDAAKAPTSGPDSDIGLTGHGGWTAERRRQHSEKMKAFWHDEEHRRQHSEKQKAAWQRRHTAGSSPAQSASQD